MPIIKNVPCSCTKLLKQIYCEVVVRITDAPANSVQNMFSTNCENSPRLKPLRKCTAFTWYWYSSIFIFKQKATWKYWRSITNENKTILKVDRCPRTNHAFLMFLPNNQFLECELMIWPEITEKSEQFRLSFNTVCRNVSIWNWK